MAIEIRPVRKFLFTDTDSKVYEVIIKQTDADSAAVVARQIGIASDTPSVVRRYSVPSFDLTETAAVVLSSKVAIVMSPNTPVSQLCVGAFYDASNEAGAGAALATLLS